VVVAVKAVAGASRTEVRETVKVVGKASDVNNILLTQ